MYSATHISPKVGQLAQNTKCLFLSVLRQRLDAIEVKNPQVARWLCQVIPARCPFERDIRLGNQTLFHIPPLCKLNPFYEQLVGLRFRALTFLADICGEDVAKYC